MYFTLTSTTTPSSSSTSLIPLLYPSHQTSFFNFPTSVPKHYRRRHSQTQTLSVKSSSHKPQTTLFPLYPPHHDDYDNKKNNNTLNWIAKPIAFTLFCVALGFCPIRFGGFQLPAIAVAASSSEVLKRTKSKEQELVVELKQKDHEYSNFTRRLLEKVVGLVRSIEEVRSGNGDLKDVELALKEVRSKKRELQEEIMNGLYAELRVLKDEKEKLVKQSEELLDLVLKEKREQESLLRRVDGDDNEEEEEVKPRMVELEEKMQSGEKEYNVIWEKVGEIEDQIMRREAMALSIGVRELSFIERECELLVEKFRWEMRQRSKDR